ncbi:MAG: ferric iron uptake transcriptional regulator [Chromatiales bacterium]|nr:ferric iron uptake transcriptional regulator [Chromatiales bacterium]
MNQQDIKRVGLKVTVPRLKILKIMEQADSRHVTAEHIHKKLTLKDENVGLATIYNVLAQFEAAGLILRRYLKRGQACYEINRGDHHDHMVCTQCGRIIEFVDSTIEDRQEAIAKKHGFTLNDHSLVMYVDCQANNCKHLKHS